MFDQLRLVKVSGIAGTRLELGFISFLLLASPALERMTLKPASANGQLLMLKELLRFRRASVRAEIVYLDPWHLGILQLHPLASTLVSKVTHRVNTRNFLMVFWAFLFGDFTWFNVCLSTKLHVLRSVELAMILWTMLYISVSGILTHCDMGVWLPKQFAGWESWSIHKFYFRGCSLSYCM